MLGGWSGHEGGYGKAVEFGGSGAVMTIQNVRARESVLVAGWVFEPESEAVGMRCAAFEGPLVSFALGGERKIDLQRGSLRRGRRESGFSRSSLGVGAGVRVGVVYTKT